MNPTKDLRAFFRKKKLFESMNFCLHIEVGFKKWEFQFKFLNFLSLEFY